MAKDKDAPAQEFVARRGTAGMTVGYTNAAGDQVEIEADSSGYFHPDNPEAEAVLRDSFGLLTQSEAAAADEAEAARAAAAAAAEQNAEKPVETKES